MAVCPDLAGLSLASAYQAALAAGYRRFKICAYRQGFALNAGYLFREVAPAIGYVMQTTSPGSGGQVTARTPPEGSFYTLIAQAGVPDQFPEPGAPVDPASALCIVYQVTDSHQPPVGHLSAHGTDPATGVIAWWEYAFEAPDVPVPLADEMAAYNGMPRAPVDVASHQWLEQAVDPLAIFSAPPVLDPSDLLSDIPQFERSSYEIIAVLRVVANELARIAAGQQALSANCFPRTADLLLGRFESELGLPVYGWPPQPDDLDLQVRRATVQAYMQRLRTEGRGLDWLDAITSLVDTNWNYAEHDPADPDSPPPYVLEVNIPQVYARVGWNFVRDVTPAHLAISQGYTGGWLVGISLLDEASDAPGSGFDLL